MLCSDETCHQLDCQPLLCFSLWSGSRCPHLLILACAFAFDLGLFHFLLSALWKDDQRCKGGSAHSCATVTHPLSLTVAERLTHMLLCALLHSFFILLNWRFHSIQQGLHQQWVLSLCLGYSMTLWCPWSNCLFSYWSDVRGHIPRLCLFLRAAWFLSGREVSDGLRAIVSHTQQTLDLPWRLELCSVLNFSNFLEISLEIMCTEERESQHTSTRITLFTVALSLLADFIELAGHYEIPQKKIICQNSLVCRTLIPIEWCTGWCISLGVFSFPVSPQCPCKHLVQYKQWDIRVWGAGLGSVRLNHGCDVNFSKLALLFRFAAAPRQIDFEHLDAFQCGVDLWHRWNLISRMHRCICTINAIPSCSLL